MAKPKKLEAKPTQERLVEASLAEASKVIEKMLGKDLRMVDEQYVLSLVTLYLEEAFKKAFDEKLVDNLVVLIKHHLEGHKKAMLDAIEEQDLSAEGEGATKEREEKCKPLAKEIAIQILETPIHSSDDEFLKVVAKEVISKLMSGVTRLDVEIVWQVIRDTFQRHSEVVFLEKFGKGQMEITLGDVDRILKERFEREKAEMKTLPEEK